MSDVSRRPLRPDLVKRFEEAEQRHCCLVALDDKDAHRLREAARRGQILEPTPQLYAREEYWRQLGVSEKHLHLLHSLSQLHPDWIFCGASAAVAHGLAVSNRLLGSVHVATSRTTHGRGRRGIARHIVEKDTHTVANGIPATSFIRSVFDAVRTTDFRTGLALCDSALRVGNLTSEQLVEEFQKMDARLRGKAWACAVASLADPRPESGGESVARAVMMQLGVMPPELQALVGDQIDGLTDYRADYKWVLADGTVVLGELDGREKYLNPAMTQGRDAIAVMADERLRESRVSATGAKILRFSYAEATNPTRFAHLLKAFGVPFGYPIPEVAKAG